MLFMYYRYAILFLLSSFMLLHPSKIISLVISSFILLRISSTPCCPPAPRAKRKPFPKLQAVAPNDKAFKTCVPLLIPPSKIISSFPPTASTIADQKVLLIHRVACLRDLITILLMHQYQLLF